MIKLLFWGFLCIHLDLNFVMNGTHTLNLIPDFIGYLLLFWGVQDLGEESDYFEKVRPFALGMIAYSAVMWLAALLGLQNGTLLWQVLTLIEVCVLYYAAGQVIEGVLEIETYRKVGLEGSRLNRWWKELAAVHILEKVMTLIGNLTGNENFMTITTMLVIAGVVLTVLYLWAWWKTARKYEAFRRKKAAK